MNLPTALHSAAQVRQLDRQACERLGIPSYTLMKRAGVAAFRVMRERWPNVKRIFVACGSGNNGGDGYVLARLAMQAGLSVTVIALFDANSLRGDALTAYREFADAGGHTVRWSDSALMNADLIVDAIFGTGLSRPLDPALRAQVFAINESPAPVLALDVPSGLDADTGRVMGAAIVADCTLTFVGLKLGFYLGAAPDYIGELAFDALDIPPNMAEVESMATRIDQEWLKSVLPRRSKLAHKGSSGQVLVIGGGIGMAGAARLTGEACLRVGAGLVTIATHAASVASIVTERPELIVRAVATELELRSLMSRADVIAIGPGLGQDDWAKLLFDATLESGKPLVVDADALNLLSMHPRSNSNWILTPHPGEAGRLLGSSTSDIQSDRWGSALGIARKFGGTVVLKGANTLVVHENQMPSICDRGNPAMATPGMGDVLTGVIAGLLAQLKDSWTAARAGVVAHAAAGDLAALKLGGIDRGLIASDLFAELPKCVSDG